MAKTQVVILAAGGGSRLGAMAEGLPKCLLQVGGKPLVEHQLGALAEAGAAPVLMVVGYAADLVRERVESKVETVLNARYDRTNSLYSLWLAREWVRGPVIVTNSDMLYDREVVDRLIAAGPDHLVYDSTSGHAPEHMKVRVRNGQVVDISKELPREKSDGENVGMIYLSASSIRKVLAEAEELIKEGRQGAFWAEALRSLIKTGEIEMGAVDVSDLPWVEIDCPYDLDHARRDVWPAIQKRANSVVRRNLKRHWVKLALVGMVAVGALIGSRFPAAPATVQTWGPLPADTGREVRIMVKDSMQTWNETAPGGRIETCVTGPQSIRVDLRCLLGEGVEERVPYLVEVSCDGKRVGWHELNATPRDSVVHPGGTVCDRDKIYLTVPEGSHRIQVRLLAGNVSKLLVRFRVLEDEG